MIVPNQAIELIGQSLIECGDIRSFFNWITSLVPTPSQFGRLSHSEQIELFGKLKQLSRFTVTNCTQNHCWCNGHHFAIYRPIYPLPAEWSFYRRYLDDAFPRGEHKSVDELISIDNYQLLYRWITGGCTVCGSHEFYWSEGDKHIEYYCPICRDETCFIKGHWAYM